LGDIRDLVDVELDEMGAGEFLGEPNSLLLASAIMLGCRRYGFGGGKRGRDLQDVLYDLWSNDLAGTTPGCEGIENDDLVVLKSGLELCFAVHHHVSISPSIARLSWPERVGKATRLRPVGRQNIP
jgi:hypothetical protein